MLVSGRVTMEDENHWNLTGIILQVATALARSAVEFSANKAATTASFSSDHHPRITAGNAGG